MDISFSENDGVAADLDSASIPLNIQGGFDFGRSAHGFALNVVDFGAVAYKVVPVQVVSQSAAGRSCGGFFIYIIKRRKISDTCCYGTAVFRGKSVNSGNIVSLRQRP